VDWAFRTGVSGFFATRRFQFSEDFAGGILLLRCTPNDPTEQFSLHVPWRGRRVLTASKTSDCR